MKRGKGFYGNTLDNNNRQITQKTDICEHNTQLERPVCQLFTLLLFAATIFDMEVPSVNGYRKLEQFGEG